MTISSKNLRPHPKAHLEHGGRLERKMHVLALRIIYNSSTWFGTPYQTTPYSFRHAMILLEV